jgi:hypothetical protein
MPVPALVSEILYFASPNHMDVLNVVVQAHNPQKKVSKEKATQMDAACFLRFSHLSQVVKREKGILLSL